MKYKGNVYSYFNLSGILFCIFIAWASYYNYKNLQITGLLAFFVFCVLKCAMLAKFKKDIEEAENKKREIYGTDVFKKIKANSINEEINAKVVEYKENIWSRMIKFIKKLWHRN